MGEAAFFQVCPSDCMRTPRRVLCARMGIPRSPLDIQPRTDGGLLSAGNALRQPDVSRGDESAVSRDSCVLRVRSVQRACHARNAGSSPAALLDRALHRRRPGGREAVTPVLVQEHLSGRRVARLSRAVPHVRANRRRGMPGLQQMPDRMQDECDPHRRCEAYEQGRVYRLLQLRRSLSAKNQRHYLPVAVETLSYACRFHAATTRADRRRSVQLHSGCSVSG